MQQAQYKPETRYRYYGAPATASREGKGGLAEHYLGVREATQALALAAALTPHDFVSALTASDDAQVDIAKAPNGMAPAQGELKICAVSNVVKNIPKVVQPVVTCEVCKKKFATIHTLSDHEKSWKHMNNLKKLNDSITPNLENPPNGAVRENPPTCEVCKIQLKNLHDLRSHEAGKKHKKNLERLQDSITPEPAKPPNGAVEASIAPAVAVADSVIPAVVLEGGAAQGEVKICTVSNVVEKIPKGVQPLTCEACKIQFKHPNDLRDHEARSKKHKKNLEKLQDSITPEPAKPPNGSVGASTAPAAAVADGVIPAVVLEAGAAQGELKVCTVSNVAVGASRAPAAVADGMIPAVEPKKRKRPAATPVDLEARKRRLIEKGIAEGAIRICTACNVVVNNQKGYDIHITGVKHKANVQKQQQAQLPYVSTAVGAGTAPAAAVADGVIPAVVLEAGAAQGELKVCTVSNVAVGASTAPAAVADGMIPAVEPKKRKRPAATPVDLEARKRRLIEKGVAEGAIRICTACNVVVNNQKGYDIHITGVKHKANVQKQQQAQLPYVSTAVGAGTAPAAAVADGVQPKMNMRPVATPENLQPKEEATACDWNMLTVN